MLLKKIILTGFVFFSFCQIKSQTDNRLSISDDSLHTFTWKQIAAKMPDAWYGSAQAVRVAENVVLYQRNTGGWSKNRPLHHALTEAEKEKLLAEKSRTDDSTIDNGATVLEMDFLAKVYHKTASETCKDAFLRGLDYLLEAQYDNGGWPQFYPLRKGYYSHITYNDDAMVNVMKLLQKIGDKNKAYRFVREDDPQRCADAFDKGVGCILKTQYRQHGILTVWCAQHDTATLAPAKARAYELPSLSAYESVNIVLLLKKIKNPSPEITDAINAAVRWFEKVRIDNIRIETFTNEDGKPDRRMVSDPDATPLWARFYELDDNRPFFCDRDGIKKYSLSEIGYERRTGYTWFTDRPLQLFH